MKRRDWWLICYVAVAVSSFFIAYFFDPNYPILTDLTHSSAVGRTERGNIQSRLPGFVDSDFHDMRLLENMVLESPHRALGKLALMKRDAKPQRFWYDYLTNLVGIAMRELWEKDREAALYHCRKDIDSFGRDCAVALVKQIANAEELEAMWKLAESESWSYDVLRACSERMTEMDPSAALDRVWSADYPPYVRDHLLDNVVIDVLSGSNPAVRLSKLIGNATSEQKSFVGDAIFRGDVADPRIAAIVSEKFSQDSGLVNQYLTDVIVDTAKTDLDFAIELAHLTENRTLKNRNLMSAIIEAFPKNPSQAISQLDAVNGTAVRTAMVENWIQTAADEEISIAEQFAFASEIGDPYSRIIALEKLHANLNPSAPHEVARAISHLSSVLQDHLLKGSENGASASNE